MNPSSIAKKSQLPNAPLTEVVFEMRWKLQGDEPVPIPFRNDPGYYVMADQFNIAASQNGFNFAKKLSNDPITPPHTISWRYYKQPDQPFPLWQIGPGIFAVNESTSYEWNSYKRLCLLAAKALTKCYPKMYQFELEPIRLELRYIDSFRADDKSSETLVSFLNENTALGIKLPSLVPGKLRGLANGQIVLNFPVKGMGETSFVVRAGEGDSQGIKSMILESKVITKLSGISIERAQLVAKLSQWLENAHEITSPFFKGFIKDHLMKKFTGS